MQLPKNLTRVKIASNSYKYSESVPWAQNKRKKLISPETNKQEASKKHIKEREKHSHHVITESMQHLFAAKATHNVVLVLLSNERKPN